MKYTLGLDFGTLSVRALIVDARTGKEAAHAVSAYRHAVMQSAIGQEECAGREFALQYPPDYLESMREAIDGAVKKAGIDVKDIAGVGIDFTSCTVLPVDKEGVPLCTKEEFAEDPHSYVKLWKHHAAQSQADEINAVASARGEKWLKRYGGTIGCEWQFPKLLEVLEKSPRVYNATAYWCEAADWIVWQLTGRYVKNACCAGYKGMWSKKDGYPSEDFFEALNPAMRNVIKDKFDAPFAFPGERAGVLNGRGAALTGLSEGTPVAVPVIDAHAALPACKIVDDNVMLIIVGTSACHISLGKDVAIDGICGVVEDGIMPGHFAYESGQASAGDLFEWTVKKILPQSYRDEAEKRGMSVYGYLDELASELRPGESGLIALDWFNGNRSVLSDSRLSGAIIGLTLSTKAEEIYLALAESMVFGTRAIVENYRKNGIDVDKIVLAGGIAEKSDFVTQLFSDILNMPVCKAGSSQAGALGSAIYASVAAGADNGGYDDLRQAALCMGSLKDKVFTPDPSRVKAYDKLYAVYAELYEKFGRDGKIMHILKEIAKESTDENNRCD